MRKWIAVLLAIVALGAAAPMSARAGEPGQVVAPYPWLGVQLGGSIPMGDLGEALSPGFAGGLSLTARDTRHRGTGVQVAYHAWGQRPRSYSSVLDYFSPGWTFRLHAIQTTAFVLADLPAVGAATPYVRVGGGLYWLRSRLDTSSGDLEDTEYRLGYNAGAGLRLPLGTQSTVGLEGAFHSILFDGKEWRGAATLGMNFGLF